MSFASLSAQGHSTPEEDHAKFSKNRGTGQFGPETKHRRGAAAQGNQLGTRRGTKTGVVFSGYDLP
ncbi:MAG: hypothetical protein IJG84_03385 [Kiritimatiellae bacterium]|nr:hypothetical protein [Kiritimatiellia bacterium]